MNTTRLFLLTLSLLLFMACNKNRDQGAVSGDNEVIDINVNRVLDNSKVFNLSKIVKDVEFVTLESTAESFFSSTSRIQITKSYILIGSDPDKRLLLFDRSGKFLRQIGRTGQGPGEYISPSFASINPTEDFIIVKDGMGGNLLKYDLNGVCLKQNNVSEYLPHRIESHPIFLDAKNFALAAARPFQPKDGYHRVVVFNHELQFVEYQLPVANNDSLCLKSLNPPVLSPGSDMSLYFEGFTDTVYSLQVGQVPKAMYHFTIDENAYTLAYQTWKDQSKKPMDFTYVRSVTDLPNHLIFQTHAGESYQMIYDKKKKEAYSPIDLYDCDTTLYRRRNSLNLTNDLFGYGSIVLSRYFPNQNLVVCSIDLDRAISRTDLDCLRQKKVLLPKKRDQLIDMIENSTGEELPVLALLFLK